MNCGNIEEYLTTTPSVPGWKRALDTVCILLSLVVVLPLMLLIAVFIKSVSSGPVFFRQQRIGLGGRRFTLLKFRSMHVNADTSVHQQHTEHLMRSGVEMVKLDKADDPRMIPGGRILRATGLDELPQLINILLGDMSLVGPRPCVPYEFELYEEWQKERCNGLPGLTGLWQVAGKNRTTFEQMIRLDIRYLREASPWVDLVIMANTIPALIGQALDKRARRDAEEEEFRSKLVTMETVEQEEAMWIEN